MKGRPTTPYTHPPCPVCKGDVPRMEGEKKGSHMRRKACSVSCRTVLITGRQAEQAVERREAANREGKECTVCGGKMFPKKRESLHHFDKRKSCSPKCAGYLRGRSIYEKPRIEDTDVRLLTPETDIDFGQGFMAHNLQFKRHNTKMVPPDPVYTLGGVSPWSSIAEGAE